MASDTTTILVVDDTEAERYYVSRVLRKAGFEVREGATGTDALKLAQEQPDLITLDVRLPDINGLDVCRRLKSDPATRDIPVLHISASYTSAESRTEGLEGGADGYLTHPADPAELVATVRALLRVRRAEARVRAAAREWVATFDLIDDAVCLTDGDDVVLRCNRAFARLLDREFTDVIGRPLADLLPALAPLIAPGSSGVTEVRIGERHFRVSSGVGPSGEPGGAHTRAWVLGDVTDRRRVEESLRASEEQAQSRLEEIEAIYTAAPIGLCVLDRELRYVRINGQRAAMNGLPIAAHLGRTVREVLPQLADALEPKLRSVLKSGQPLTGLEIRGETPAAPGRERVWIENWYPVRASDGRVVGVNIAAEEVTEQRHTQEQLQQAQRLEAVGRLAGGVAHETNNQMTVVLGCANFALRHSGLAPDVRSDLEQIRKAAERTASITAQLLAFGRRQVSRPEITDLAASIHRLQPILERAVGPLASLHLELGGEAMLATVDPGQLDQVLLNLAMNGRDAMAVGGRLTIEATRRRVDRSGGERFVGEEIVPGDYVRIAVSDTGQGMDEATMRRAFEPFFTTKGVGQGTGLGLSMVYGIVRQNGGYISVASQVGKGTTFVVYFPESAERAARSEGVPRGAAQPFSRTVLIVEDDPSVRAILVRELESHNYRVIEAGDGREALDRVRGHAGTLDVVVTDVQMPGLDGRSLADALTELRPGLPVVFMSGHPDGEVIRELTSAGRPFLQKPFTGEQLASLVEGSLGSSSS
ncbi:MAG TPA: response regulator [Gemmatimonadales bacterium]|nr:response regulator [Gemmatimonadales bacterium]